MDVFTQIRVQAEQLAEMYNLNGVSDVDLLGYGEVGTLVVITRYEWRLRSLVSRARGADAAEQEDLQQSALEGLISALQDFDPQRGGDPWTYAQTRVVRVLGEANADASPKPVAARTHARFWQAMEAMDYDASKAREWSALQRLSGHELVKLADGGDLVAAGIVDARIARAERKGIDVAVALEEKGRGLERSTFDTIHQTLTYTSVDAPVSAEEAEDARLGDFLADGTASAAYEAVENSDQVRDLLSRLSVRDAEIIRALFGIGGPEKTPTQLSEEYGITANRVRDLKMVALRKMARGAA